MNCRTSGYSHSPDSGRPLALLCRDPFFFGKSLNWRIPFCQPRFLFTHWRLSIKAPVTFHSYPLRIASEVPFGRQGCGASFVVLITL
ncbi:Uncharacterised protein [Serratia liquefaciens]|nr:Uncharacterised protein [Serratia liquefaciens]